jgi:hypothetical protein
MTDYFDDNNPDTPDNARILIVIASNSAHAALYVSDAANIGSADLDVHATDVFEFDGIANGRTADADRFVIGTAPQQ